jgi:hypothetical protein
MNWRKSPINARHHPLMAGILRRFGKPGYCAYQWMLDLYAIHFDAAGGEVPLVMDHKTLKRELDIRRWESFWGFLRFVNDWPAVEPQGGGAMAAIIPPAQGPINTGIPSAYNPSTTQIQSKLGLNESNSGREYSSLLPKWIFWEEGGNVFIYIPNFLKTADEWTMKKHRKGRAGGGDYSGAPSGEMPAALRRVLRTEQRREEQKRGARGGARGRARSKPSQLFSQEIPQGPPAVLASFLLAPCREIGRLPPRGVAGDFNPWWFIKKRLHAGYHPEAIVKSLLAVKAQWESSLDLAEIAEAALDRASVQFGNQWDNSEITRLLEPVFNRKLMPVVIAGEVEA